MLKRPQPVPAAPSDLRIVNAAKTGDIGALGYHYEKYRRRIFNLCLRMVRDQADAEDLTQDVFVQLFRKIGTFRGESAFSTWLHRLAVNMVLMDIRSQFETLFADPDRTHERGRRFALRAARPGRPGAPIESRPHEPRASLDQLASRLPDGVPAARRAWLQAPGNRRDTVLLGRQLQIATAQGEVEDEASHRAAAARKQPAAVSRCVG